MFYLSISDGYIGYFFLAIINNTDMSVYVQFLSEHSFHFFGVYTMGMKLLHCMVNLCLTSLRNERMFSKVAAPFIFLPAVFKGSNLSTYIFLNTYYLCFLYYSHPSGYDMVSHYGFDFHFPDN